MQQFMMISAAFPAITVFITRTIVSFVKAFIAKPSRFYKFLTLSNWNSLQATHYTHQFYGVLSQKLTFLGYEKAALFLHSCPVLLTNTS